MNAADLRNIAQEAWAPLEQQMDAAEILAELGKVCRDKGGDWSQLKALVKAKIRDARDESGEGTHVANLVEKAEAASAYADLIGNMNKKNFSDAPDAGNPAPAPTAPQPRTNTISAPAAVHDGIPDFLRRATPEASA